MITSLYEPFRHWSEGGSIYILSDLHFDDLDCRLIDPTWITPQEQIAIINIMVMKNDSFVCLGDVGAHAADLHIHLAALGEHRAGTTGDSAEGQFRPQMHAEDPHHIVPGENAAVHNPLDILHLALLTGCPSHRSSHGPSCGRTPPR